MTKYDQLYKHQQRGVDLFIENRQAFANFGEPGTGKTATVIVALEKLNATKVLVVCPNVLKLTWAAEFAKWGTQPWFVAPAIGATAKKLKAIDEALGKPKFVVVINYESIITPNLYKRLAAVGFDYVVADECFPYNTKVKTDIGLVSIGDIVEQNKATKVLSCDLSSGELRWQRIKKRKANKSKQNFLRIKHEFGEIICTENHKIYTLQQGYKKAVNISAGNCLRILSEEIFNYSEAPRKKGAFLWEVLFGKMANELYRLAKNYRGKDKKDRGPKTSTKNLLFLQNNIQDKGQECKVLREIMLSKMEDEATRNKKCCLFKNGHYDVENDESKIRGDDKRTENCRVSKNNQAFLEHSNTGSKRRGNTKGSFNENKRRNQYNKKSRWQWLWANSSSENIKQCFKVENGVCGFIKRFWQRVPVSLQNRYSKSSFKNSNRDRWNISQGEVKKGSGQKERCGTKISRVESIQVLERTDIERLGLSVENNQCVYDLEIENDHNYFAENVLVSNSHRLKSAKSKASDAIKTFKANGRWILTGTPTPNGPLDIWSQIDFIKSGYLYPHKYIPKRVIGFYMFRKRYADIYTGRGYPVIKKYINQDELKRYIDKISYRVTKEECLDLPDKVYKEILIDLEPKTQRLYDKMADDLFAEIVTSEGFEQVKTVSARIALTKILRLQQITSGFVKADDGTENLVGTEKIEALREILEDLEGENVIVWTRFNFEVTEIAKALEGHNVRQITGQTPDKDRQAIVEEFQLAGRKGPIVLIINMQIGGLGLTLTAANHSIYYSRNYSFSDAVQSSDRVHRIGQTKKCVYYDLVCRDTIDEAVLTAIKKKQKLSDRLTGDDIKRIMRGKV